MNPYIIIAVMLVVDIITLPMFIKSILKKDKIKRKGIVIALCLVAFIAIEGVTSFFYIDSKQFYDREGNVYADAESVIYYDRDGTEFLLKETGLNRKHFESKDGKRLLIAERMYLDSEGYLYFDRDELLSRTEKEYVYVDSEGNEYFKAEDVKFNRKGEIKLTDKQ